jgi:hypothetical protein
MLEPSDSNLQNIFGRSAGPNRHKAWLGFLLELDIYREPALVNQLAAEPLVENSLDSVDLSSEFDAYPDLTAIHKE